MSIESFYDNEPTLTQMLSLREQGLTNKQISEKLDITYTLVLKKLGKGPRRSIQSPMAKDTPGSQSLQDNFGKAETYQESKSLLTELAIHLSGEVAQYEILKGSAVLITREGHNLPQFSRLDLLKFINELQEVSRRLEDG